MQPKSSCFIFVISLCLFAASQAFAQDRQEPDYKLIDKLSRQAEGYLEGFSKKTAGQEIDYTSARNDFSRGFLTRCNTGNREIEWETQAVPLNFEGKNAGFIWLSSFDFHGGNKPFDVFVNGTLRFTFSELNNRNWTVKNEEGAELSFITVKTDQYGDSHGYTLLNAPAKWLSPGKPLLIKVCGQALKSNTWYMAFQCDNVVSYLKGAAENEGWFELSASKGNDVLKGELHAPSRFAGQTLPFLLNDISGRFEFTEGKDEAVADFSVPGVFPGASFTLFGTDKTKICFVPEIFGNHESAELGKSSLITVTSRSEGAKALVRIVTRYQPDLISAMSILSALPQSQAGIRLMNSSHQDIAWMDSPGSCIIQRDTMLLTPLLEAAEKDSSYRFDIEDALMIREFIGRHPERKAELRQMLKDGRLSCGATYIQPYEEMYSGEALARQFYLGKKWLKKEFGYNSTIYWNMDVPGRSPQMPQMMKRSGVSYLLLSRQAKGVFRWYSPDSSFVTCYSPGHYGNDYPNLNKNFADAASYLAKLSAGWCSQNSFRAGQNPVIPLLSDWDMSPAKDYSRLIESWNNLGRRQNPDGTDSILPHPKISLSGMPAFMHEVEESVSEMKSIRGERPDVWMYIHGPSHCEAVGESRKGDILMTVAEKFSTIDALLKGSFAAYPEERLNRAWESKIYPDHGWGGKNGDITDAVFAAKYRFALSEASQMAENAMTGISGNILTDRKKGQPVIVFNSLSWDRTEPVSFRVSFEKGASKGVNVRDAAGFKIPVHLPVVTRYEDGSVCSAECTIIAPEIPSVGFSTFYAYPSEFIQPTQVGKEVVSYESKYYKIIFARGGISQVTDKELDKPLLDTRTFLGGEIFTMQSVGEDAGEWADMQHPGMNGFDKSGNYDARWQLVEDGPVYAAFFMQSPILHARVEEKLILYKQIKRMDIQLAIRNFDGTMFREFRMAWPLAMKDGQVAYEVPFGVVEVGKDEMAGAAGERYTRPAREIHPRSIEDWISASGNGIGVTLSSSVAVNDYLNPADTSDHQTILQPLLFASRRSCNGEGNTYPQPGDHLFSFSVTSHQPGWRNGRLSGKESNEPLMTVVNPMTYKRAFLPEKLSFFGSGNNAVLITAIKKAQDGDRVIIRFVESEGSNAILQLASCFRPLSCRSTNLIEEVSGDTALLALPFETMLGKYAIQTFSFGFKPGKPIIQSR